MKRESKRNKRRLLGIVGVAVFAVGLGASSAASAASAAGNPVAMSSLLQGDQTPADLLPEEDGQPFAEGLGLVNETSRLIGENEDARFWIVLDEESKVCLVSLFVSDGWSTISCVTAQDFQSRGVSSLHYSPDDYVEAYLAPDGLRPAAIPNGLDALDSELIVGDSRGGHDAIEFSADKASATARGIPPQIQMPLLHPDPDGPAE